MLWAVGGLVDWGVGTKGSRGGSTFTIFDINDTQAASWGPGEKTGKLDSTMRVLARCSDSAC